MTAINIWGENLGKYGMPYQGSKSAIEFGLLLFASMAATYVGFEMIYKNLPQAAKETSETSDK